MYANLSRCLDFVLEDEGGLRVAPEEPGGASNMGVSLTALEAWRKRQGKRTPNLEDLRNMQKWEARLLYIDEYAQPIGFDALPLGVDYVALDHAINSGVHAARDLIADTASIADARLRIDRMTDLRMDLKRASPEWPRFAKGWTNRIAIRVPQRALAMVKPGQP